MIKKDREQRKVIDLFNEEWIDLGRKAFARFFGLSVDEVYKMASNPNDVFYEMMGEISSSLNEYEDFMVKIKKMKEKETLTRLDFLDL